jgi:nitrate reductase cytochrome c-type subunit
MKRKGIVFLFLLLTASFIAICDFSYRSGQKGAYMPLERELTSQDFYFEEGFYQEPHSLQRHSAILWDTLFQRNAKEYKQNRSFYGSPPSIPHPISKEMSMGGKDCLQCHKYGGFVDKWKAYTPICPHPEMVNCRQCHVPQKSQKLLFEDQRLSQNALCLEALQAFPIPSKCAPIVCLAMRVQVLLKKSASHIPNAYIADNAIQSIKTKDQQIIFLKGTTHEAAHTRNSYPSCTAVDLL